MDIKKAHFNGRPKECSPKPRPGMKRLSEPRVCDFAKRREWRFRHHGTESRLFRQRLQNLGRSHRLAESENAIGMMVSFEPVNPAMNVVGFFQSVSRQITSTVAMRASVRKKDGIVISYQPASISGNTQSVVANPVK